MEIINTVLGWTMRKRLHQIELFTKFPIDVQNEWFGNLIKAGAKTRIGEKYEFSSIKTVQQFKERLPVKEYDDLKPYIERAIQGEKDVLWPGETRWFAKSSGTTSDKSKFIPVTRESLEENHFKGGKDLLALYFTSNPNSKIFTGRGLVLGGSSEVNQFQSQSYWGDLSAVIIKNLPFWAEFHRTPSRKIALLPEWEEKIEKMGEITSQQNITTLTGVPSWTLVVLKKVLEITGKTTIGEVWPNLEMYTHGGVSFIPYRDQFDEIINLPNLKYLETYNASEGFFGIQDVFDNQRSASLLLMLDYGIYYEFMPLSERGKKHPKTLELHEVEIDTNYAIIISTNGGLWRYLIGDTVVFTSLDPFRIKVTGRIKQFINVFGEELMVDNAENALKIACEKTNARVSDYTACPVFMEGNEKGAHEWAIEFEKKPDNMDFFLEALDNALKSINSDYEAKRYKDFILKAPIVHVLPQNTFYNWMKKRGKLGGQNKVPRLSNERKYMDEVLAL
ncbi:MAG TPA: hypothetical protein DDX92_00835 [Flavobacteriales bacterium]|jgi:hypothetical protein|nr:hypothetical protein [Flavobacteriales bacterium]